MAAGALCFMVLLIPLALLIGAVILRAAVSITNSVLAGSGRSRRYDDDDDDDYYPPPRRRRRSSDGEVPMPAIGQAMVIGLVNFVDGLGISFALGGAVSTRTGTRSGVPNSCRNRSVCRSGS